MIRRLNNHVDLKGSIGREEKTTIDVGVLDAYMPAQYLSLSSAQDLASTLSWRRVAQHKSGRILHDRTKQTLSAENSCPSDTLDRTRLISSFPVIQLYISHKRLVAQCCTGLATYFSGDTTLVPLVKSSEHLRRLHSRWDCSYYIVYLWAM